jgi:ribonucleoside-triphosphate reductase
MSHNLTLTRKEAFEIDRGEVDAKDNANLQANAETSHKKKADRISKEQYLSILPTRIKNLHEDGDIHIHDLEYFGTRAFCQDWDLRYFFYYGLMPDGLGTKASVAGPAKRAEVAILHAVKALGSAQTNFAGGQGFYNFLTFFAPYFKDLEYKEIKQLMQMFVYEMTQMMVARGGQIVFSSVQLSPGVPTIWKDKPIVYQGKVWDGKQAPLQIYDEFEYEVRLGFKAFMEIMMEGDYWGKPFNFPKPEISIEPDFMQEDEDFNALFPEIPTYRELYLMAFELAAKYGTPYFDNQLPLYRNAGKGISCYQCCAYQFSSNAEDDSHFDDKLYFKDGMHFSMGAWQVVSINLPRIAYQSNHHYQEMVVLFKQRVDDCVEVFKKKRELLERILINNRLPFMTQQPKDPHTNKKGTIAVDIDSLVYIVGIVGLNEMMEHCAGLSLHESKIIVDSGIMLLTEMEYYLKEVSQKNNMDIKLARTPAETTAQKFAIADVYQSSPEISIKAKNVVKGNLNKAYDIYVQDRDGELDLPIYYTNGTHVAPNADVNLLTRMTVEQVFFPIVDGGNICHIWLGEGDPNPEGLMEFAMNIAKNTQIGYFAFTKDFTLCLEDFSVSSGLQKKCSKCGTENVEHYSRITGYVQAVSGWNAAKKQELEDRKRYVL